MPETIAAISARPLSPSRASLARTQRDFAAALGRAGRDPGERPATPLEGAREAAQQLVSVALVQPLLKQLRDSSRAAPPFAPTQAEKQFAAIGDATLAQDIARAANFPLVDRLARDLLRMGAARAADIAEAAAPAPTAPPSLAGDATRAPTPR